MSERKQRFEAEKPPEIRDPAQAIAVAKCVVARDLGAMAIGKVAPRFFHPGECAYCEMDVEWLRAGVAEFNEWAGLNPPTTVDPAFPDLLPLQPNVESFSLLPRDEQAIRVKRAQGYL